MPVDPFFDKPYEPGAAADAMPAWEAAGKPVGRAVSANIKHKKRVAALFKAPQKPDPVVVDDLPAEHIPVLAMADESAEG